MDNNELKHYGIPGMKWGVRRAKIRAAVAGIRARNGKPKAEEKYKQKQATADKLDSLYRRAKSAKSQYKVLKKKYKDVHDNTPEVKRGKKAAAIALGTVGATALVGFGIGVGAQAALGSRDW